MLLMPPHERAPRPRRRQLFAQGLQLQKRELYLASKTVPRGELQMRGAHLILVLIHDQLPTL